MLTDDMIDRLAKQRISEMTDDELGLCLKNVCRMEKDGVKSVDISCLILPKN